MKAPKVFSAQVLGLKGLPISVETDVSSGIYSFTIVGLPDQSVAESKERVHAALKNNSLPSPKSKNHKITVSLAPAEIRKEGSNFDLAIAISYLIAIGELSEESVKDTLLIGELSLNGELQKLKGSLALSLTAKTNGFKKIILPHANKSEASIVDGVDIYGAKNIKEVVDHLKGVNLLNKNTEQLKETQSIQLPDLGEIKGQIMAKRALEIAACGGHNICLYGPPGTGKTMMARAFTGILPELNFEEALDVTQIHSIAGLTENMINIPPFRSPHHTSSYVSLLGGGSIPKPGEITLAHRGVLFLDEFPEFDRETLEGLREPLEEGFVRISRARGSEIFPSNFILLAAMNPCPCGYKGSKIKDCVCRPTEVERYQKKISGPIMDRIDLWVFVQNIAYEELSAHNNSEIQKVSEQIKNKVKDTREFAKLRNQKLGIKDKLNKNLSPKEISQIAKLELKVEATLNSLASKLQISPRMYHKILRLARTIADMEKSDKIEERHVTEAFQYRPKFD